MPPHPLTNSKIQKYYQNEPKVSGVYSRNNLPKIKDGAYGINTDEFKSMGTNWIALYVNTENVAYFGNLGVEHIPKKKIENSLEIKILTQIFIKYKHMIH